jgi:hypothetical protein
MALPGPYCFDKAEGRKVSVNAVRYNVMRGTFLHNELHPRQQDLLWFQKDGATAHTAHIAMQALRTMFPGRLIFHFREITWPTCLHDLAVPDYIL